MSELAEKPHAETLPRTTGATVMLDGRYLPPPEDRDGKLWVRTSALIQGEPGTLYSIWRDLKAIPKWQEEIQEVSITGPATSHWTMRSGDKTLTWDSEILADEPGKRIAWHSTGGDVDNAGEVIFEPVPAGRGTFVTVLQQFRMGKLASAWETIVGRNPKQAVIENLRHFKAFAETGEIPRTQRDTHAKRGFIGERKQALYGETIPTPPANTVS